MQDVFDESVSFADLNLRTSVVRGAEACGFKHPTHIQAQLIPIVLEGHDVLGQAKTGTGKTAAFGLPILARAEKHTPLQALILAPTRELAVQITAELNELARFTPIRAMAVTGGASFKKQRQNIERGSQIVVGTPGRIMDLNRRGDLAFDHFRYVVLDEVDRMLDIGFREDIRRILGRIKQPHQTVFVSATIGAEIERLARRFMSDDVRKIETSATSLTVSQVTQSYVPVPRHDKRRMLVHLLTHETPALTVVFCRMKATVRDVARYLKDKNIDAFEIHGDLRQTKRNSIMKRLRDGKLEVLVASDLAARGLDVDGISHIVNYDLPEDPEIYVHRIGRTARAGRSGVAWSFVTPEEGQRLTEIEKLTGVLIEKLEYPDFDYRPAPPPRDARPQPPARTQAPDPTPEDDPIRFPGGVAPKGSPQRRLGGRVKRKRR
jgi:ATP-dependent RNA helicase DeaD